MYIYDRPKDKTPGGFTGYMLDESATIKTYDPSAQYRSKVFEECMDHFDLTDAKTRAILLTVNEADQNNIINSLANKLYKSIVDKVDDIDFGTIPLSKGDITKIDNYAQLVDCVNIIGQMMQEYHQPTDAIETVQQAIANMVDRTDTFMKAYRLNIELPIVLYNTVALGIVSAVSYLIASTIEFIKLPKDAGFEIALDKAAAMKAKDHVLFTNLEKFNKMCDKHEIEKVVDFVISKSAKGFDPATIGIAIFSVAATFGAIMFILYTMRDLIYGFYYARISISKYLEMQAALLTMNAYNVENNLSRDEATRKKIAAKQLKTAATFKKIADKLKVEMKDGQAKADKKIKEEDSKKEKIDEVPESSAGSIF